jgi:hypothetical protein
MLTSMSTSARTCAHNYAGVMVFELIAGQSLFGQYKDYQLSEQKWLFGHDDDFTKGTVCTCSSTRVYHIHC